MGIAEHQFTFIKTTEMAAIAASAARGFGDKNHADQLAVQAMREVLANSELDVRVVIGEGERDDAPMLFIGEEMGKKGGFAVDIAVDPLEGTNMCANDSPGALTVLSAAPRGNLLFAPDCYMQKLVVGPEARDVIDLDAPVDDNLIKIAKAIGKDMEEMTVAVLERERHQDLIKEIREAGCRVRLFDDGDLGAGIQTCLDESQVDVLMGSGGAPEGVLTATVMRCLGGQIMGRLMVLKEEDKGRMEKMGISDLDKIYTSEELAKGDDMLFVATGVTDGSLLEGVVDDGDMVATHTMIMDLKTASHREIHSLFPA